MCFRHNGNGSEWRGNLESSQQMASLSPTERDSTQPDHRTNADRAAGLQTLIATHDAGLLRTVGQTIPAPRNWQIRRGKMFPNLKKHLS